MEGVDFLFHEGLSATSEFSKSILTSDVIGWP